MQYLVSAWIIAYFLAVAYILVYNTQKDQRKILHSCYKLGLDFELTKFPFKHRFRTFDILQHQSLSLMLSAQEHIHYIKVLDKRTMAIFITFERNFLGLLARKYLVSFSIFWPRVAPMKVISETRGVHYIRCLRFYYNHWMPLMVVC